MTSRVGAVAIGAGPPLDERAVNLLRLGALIALGAAQPTLQREVITSLNAGLTPDQIVEVLVALAPVVGMATVAAAAPRIALSLGYDVEAAMDVLDDR